MFFSILSDSTVLFSITFFELQVSFGSELSNRGPTFDMDLSDFMEEDGKPISYDKAYHYFSRDPSQKLVHLFHPIFRFIIKFLIYYNIEFHF